VSEIFLSRNEILSVILNSGPAKFIRATSLFATQDLFPEASRIIVVAVPPLRAGVETGSRDILGEAARVPRASIRLAIKIVI